MRTDRRTDMTKLTVAFRNFANAPKKALQEEEEKEEEEGGGGGEGRGGGGKVAEQRIK